MSLIIKYIDYILINFSIHTYIEKERRKIWNKIWKKKNRKAN